LRREDRRLSEELREHCMQTRDIMSPPGNQTNLVIPEEILKRLRASSSLLGMNGTGPTGKITTENTKNSVFQTISSLDS